MTLQEAKLHLHADVDDDGSLEHGIFRMVGDLQLNPFIRTGFLIGGRGSTINSITQEQLGKESNRKGIYLDLGGGVHGYDIDFRGWEGAIDADGNAVQWGNTGDDTEVTIGDATGADPLTQMDVLFHYLLVGEYDSRGGATFEAGEFSESGLYDPLDVTIEAPQVIRSAEDGSWFDGSLTVLSLTRIDQPIDSVLSTG